MEVWSAAALALALSVDGFAVGIAYGLRGIHVPVRSLLIIGGCSALCFSVALLSGRFVAGVVDAGTPHLIGSAVLIGLGSWHIVKGWSDRNRSSALRHGAEVGLGNPAEMDAGKEGWPTLLRLRIKALGIVVQVLRDAGDADWDGSGAIDAAEALVLGVALGLDAVAVGFGAAFMDVGFSLVGVVAGGQLLLTWAGLHAGRRFGGRWLGESGYYVPGLILILIGLLQL